MDSFGGTTVGQYRILKELGRGGMGIVYRAQHLRTGHHVALKILPATLAHNVPFIKRFQREARALQSLNHPNIVRLIETSSVGDLHFIAMEYIPGRSLRDYLRRGRLPAHQAREIALHVCDALAYAHGKGIIHRDIKPSNIMITPDGQVKVMDFGIARIVGATVQTTTGTGLGTPEYMSPEQARGFRVDHRSDLYSLGVVLYQMLAGRVPFTAEEPFAVALKHITEAPVPPRKINPQIHPGMEQIILHALEKRPEDRYQSASELAADMRTGILSPRAFTPRPKEKLWRRKRKVSGLEWVALAALAVVGFVLLAVFALSNHDSTSSRATPTASPAATIVPGTYSVRKRVTQTTPYEVQGLRGTYTAVLTLDRVEVSKKDMTFYLEEVFVYSNPDHGVRVNKKSDAGNSLIYVTDNLGQRYDQTAAGGAFAQTMAMEHNVLVSGWFKFPPPEPGAYRFSFRMDDQHVVIDGIEMR